ncbi:MAG: proprotein convertase P-domain-containing protein, partial [Phycisphaerae bacterium]|nr:proprotein convertase P-domain-containing protein [Phycisphaerae bacterium]
TAGDIDTYTFNASAGDRVYIALDGDPERNSGGDEDDDPLALDAALVVYDPDNDVLLTRHDDVNVVGSGQAPDYPAEGLFFNAPLSGTYKVQVMGAAADDYGPGRTYELAVFLNDQPPALSEDIDPEIDSLTPDYLTDTVAVVASDDAGGDSGICDAQLAPGSVNLELQNVAFTPGDPTVAFDVGLINPGESGSGKLVLFDCAGNTACAAIDIDAGAPSCSGSIVVPGTRVFHSTHEPIHAPDNQPSGPGINGEIYVAETGTISDVNVTVTLESSRVPDMDVYLESPTGTRVELITDIGSSSAFDVTDATFDDSAAGTISYLDDEPYTGTWLPEDTLGLAKLNGQNVTGTWLLNLIDNASTSSGGSRLVRWSLEIDAGFVNPEMFVGTAADTGGVQSVVLVDPDNVQLYLPDDFTPGATSVEFTVTLIDTSKVGSCTVLVTDVSDNTCESAISLRGLPDTAAPANAGTVTRDLVFGGEVQGNLIGADSNGVVSSIIVPQSLTVAEVVVDLTINTLDVGRLAATLSHNGEFAALINRVGMDERGSVGLTKDNIEITLDDDAPVADDAHEEPALGTTEFLGLHQPDGRGEFVGDGIASDDRDNMLFALAGLDAAGTWELYAADFRVQGASAAHSIFRRWKATVFAPGAPERYVGTTQDLSPQAGICSITLAAGSTNLAVDAEFTPLDEVVDYVVSLIDSDQPGSGTLEIADCAGNVTQVPISLSPALPDQNLPLLSGTVNPATYEFEGTAIDSQPGDSGIVSVMLAPHSDNLAIVSVTPDPPNAAASVDFVVGLINPLANGHGYVEVCDTTGYRAHILVELDALGPDCTGSVGNTKRYLSGVDLPAKIPDDSGAGVSSSIVVPDFDVVSDVNITFNITHPMDDDIDMTLVTPMVMSLFSDIGSTGNDFIDTTLDDEASIVIPDSSSAAPFTGSYQPEAPAMLSLLDGAPAAGTYTLKVVDDYVYNVGSFDSWSLTIESATFPQRYDGRAEDSRTHDTGICTIELLPGAANLTLKVDPFDAGDAIVRYSVELTNPAIDGAGTVLVTDCAGNTCEVPICLEASIPPARLGDLDGSGVIDEIDFLLYEPCLLGPSDAGLTPCHPCRLADFDGDEDIDMIDFANFQQEFMTP